MLWVVVGNSLFFCIPEIKATVFEHWKTLLDFCLESVP